MRRANIFLADLLQGLHALRVTDAQRARDVLGMLSLDRLEASASTSLEGAWSPSAAVPRGVDPAPAETGMPPAPPAAPPLPVLRERQEATLRQVVAPSTVAQIPSWYSETSAAARPAGPTPSPRSAQPLFPRNQTRGLLTAALSTWSEDGSVDVERVVDMLAELQPIRTWPQQTAATLRRGVQLLVDVSVGMGPFRLDVEHMIGEIKGVLAEEQISALFFAGSPKRGCAVQGGDELKDWQPPPSGTRIFLLTDLGIGPSPDTSQRAGEEEWVEFGERAALAGCSVVALVPYGPRRWPRALSRAFHIIHWDRRTTAAIVRRSLPRIRRSTS